MSNPKSDPVLAEFIAATTALVIAAKALGSSGVTSDIAEGKKTFETAREAVSIALKGQTPKKA